MQHTRSSKYNHRTRIINICTIKRLLNNNNKYLERKHLILIKLCIQVPLKKSTSQNIKIYSFKKLNYHKCNKIKKKKKKRKKLQNKHKFQIYRTTSFTFLKNIKTYIFKIIKNFKIHATNAKLIIFSPLNCSIFSQSHSTIE